MKKILFLSLVAFICSFVSINTVLAQDLPKAYLTKELYVMIDTEGSTTATVFEADMSEFNFTTLEKANRFFNFFNDPMVSFTPDIATQKVTITITPTTDKVDWQTEQWAMYFKNKIVAQRNNLGVVDFTTR
jgi:hypothetical protein